MIKFEMFCTERLLVNYTVEFNSVTSFSVDNPQTLLHRSFIPSTAAQTATNKSIPLVWPLRLWLSSSSSITFMSLKTPLNSTIAVLCQMHLFFHRRPMTNNQIADDMSSILRVLMARHTWINSCFFTGAYVLHHCHKNYAFDERTLFKVACFGWVSFESLFIWLTFSARSLPVCGMRLHVMSPC